MVAGILRRGRGEFRTYDQAREWVGLEYGVGYSYNGMWSPLARLEIRPEVPRPAAQEAYRRGA